MVSPYQPTCGSVQNILFPWMGWGSQTSLRPIQSLDSPQFVDLESQNMPFCYQDHERWNRWIWGVGICPQGKSSIMALRTLGGGWKRRPIIPVKVRGIKVNRPTAYLWTGPVELWKYSTTILLNSLPYSSIEFGEVIHGRNGRRGAAATSIGIRARSRCAWRAGDSRYRRRLNAINGLS